MLELIKDFPANVLGVRAKARVTAKDYEDVLVPAVQGALKQRDKIRLYYELGSDFEGIDPGAVFEDFKIGLGTLPHWEKLAVVTDVRWIREAVSVFAFLIHGTVKVFHVSEAAAAKNWIG